MASKTKATAQELNTKVKVSLRVFRILIKNHAWLKYSSPRKFLISYRTKYLLLLSPF